MATTTPVKPSIADGRRSAPDSFMDDRSAHAAAYPKAITVVATVAALYFGRDIFIPLAIAVLATFTLAPLVSILHKVRVPRPVAVVSVAISAFAAIFIFGAAVASQLGTLAQNIPVYQSNLEAKVKVIQDADVGPGIFDRISRLLDRLGARFRPAMSPILLSYPAPKSRPPRRSLSKSSSRRLRRSRCCRQS